MKLKLIINRFVEADSIDVPINVTTTFDATGVTQLRNTMSQIETTFKKTMSVPTYSATMKDYFSTSDLSRYEDTISKMKESISDYKPPVFAKDLFSRNESSILEMGNSYDTVLDKFKETTPVVQTIGDKLKDTFKVDYMSDLKEQTKEAVKHYQYMNDEIGRTKGKTEDAGIGLGKLASVIRSSVLIQVQALAHVLRRAFSFLEESFTAAGDYVESINLYTMSVGEFAKAGQDWAEKISNALYLDPSEIYQFTGQFYNLTRGLGASAKAADLMSRNLTQLSYDMSSYLNIDVSVANNKLMSAMSGQTKAVTSVGIAVQAASLQELAYSLGIKKSVQEMTQAEKTYLRYIQIMRSTTQMQGDLGRTIITPTNAMRLLRTQMNLLSRAIGQVFTPIIMQTIPYIIAFTQVLTELAQTLAKSMGYKLEDYLAPASSVKALADGFGDLDNSAKKAGKSVNRTLAPFDELNVVETNSKKNGAGADDSILKDLEQYLDGYDMLEFYTSNMKDKIEDIKKKIKTIGPVIAGVFSLGLIGKFLSKLGKVKTGFGGLKTPLSKVGDFVKSIYGAEGILNFTKTNKKVTSFGDGFKKVLTTIGKTVIGLAGTYDGVKRTHDAVKDLKTGTGNVLTNVGKLTVGIGEAIGAAALFGSQFGPTGTAIGAAIGVVGGLTGAFFGFLDGLQKAEEEKIAEKVFGTLHMTADEFKTTLEETGPKFEEYNKKLQESNETIAKAKDAYKENEDALDDYAYKVGTLGQTVGEEYETKIKPNLESMFANMKTVIDTEGETAKLSLVNSFKSGTDLSIEEQNRLLGDIDKNTKWVHDKMDSSQTRINEIYSTASKERRSLTADEIAEIQKLLDEMDKLTLKEVTDSELKVFQAKEKFKDKRYQLDLSSYDELKKALETYEKEQRDIIDKNYLEDKKLQEHQAYLTYQRHIEEYGDEKKAFEEYQNDLALIEENAKTTRENNITEMKKNIKNNTDSILADTVTMWKELYDKSDYESLQQRKLIEKIFNKIDPTKLKELQKQMESEGKKDGSLFKNALAAELQKEWTTKTDVQVTLDANFSAGKINSNTFQASLQDAVNKAASNVKFPEIEPGGASFKTKADGGFLKTGEMFIAREAGPELVGRIGNKTAVANNDQITSAMTNAMIVALNGANNNRQPIHNTVYIGSEKVYNGMGNYIDSQNDRYGTNYVKV